MRKLYQNPFKVLAIVSILFAAPISATAQDFEQVQKMGAFLDLMQDFFGIIDSMHAVSDDPEKAAIFQLHKIEEIYKERGERAKAVAVFEQVLEETTNTTIRNAAHFMLGDALKETGHKDEAVKVLERALKENLRNAN